MLQLYSKSLTQVLSMNVQRSCISTESGKLILHPTDSNLSCNSLLPQHIDMNLNKNMKWQWEENFSVKNLPIHYHSEKGLQTNYTTAD